MSTRICIRRDVETAFVVGMGAAPAALEAGRIVRELIGDCEVHASPMSRTADRRQRLNKLRARQRRVTAHAANGSCLHFQGAAP